MYIPVLKNRQIEMSVLGNFFSDYITEDVIPLIEIISDKKNAKLESVFIKKMNDITKSATRTPRFFVDIPKLKPKSTIEEVAKFLTITARDSTRCTDFLASMNHLPGMIPVISYFVDNPEIHKIQSIYSQLKGNGFSSIAFRIIPSHFSEAAIEIESQISSSDYIIFDIGQVNPANAKKFYPKLLQIKKNTGCKISLMVDTKADNVTNNRMIDGECILGIDASLRDEYESYGFDGFGDYAGVSSSLPSSGGIISPAGVYYSKEENCFIGYRKGMVLSDFDDHIAPSIVKSKYWNEFTTAHKNQCPGCTAILRISQGTESGKSQGKWKGITISHYVYAISDWLKERASA